MTTPSQIGSYPIERELGRGGMGIVYLGRDTKLGRSVAIKVLPDGLALDAERLGRFEREARLLASLNHPNIAGIYGLDEDAGRRFLSLEYVEGPTLGERLARGPLPLAETLDVCRQIAAALEAAHDAGVVHRDLKPGNVKLTPAGDVKVLDFGLAKGAAGTAESNPDLSQSPTMALAATGVGVILGTAAYMSPEQARGRTVDRRTDIWSFGCVMYECLTGRQLFVGETISDTIAKILEREPDWSTLPGEVPEKVRELLRRCIEKDARKRLRDIGDARIELEDVLAQRASTSRVASGVQRAGRGTTTLASFLPWLVASGAVALAAVAIAFPGLFRPGGDAPVLRFSVHPPHGVTLNLSDTSVLSPDGRTLAFTGIDSAGTSKLWLRPLGSLEARSLDGTDNAYIPFWSADGRHLGFFAEDKLKKVAVRGGAVEVICSAPQARGGTWNRDGVIVFAPAGEGPLYRVDASGGEPNPVTALDTTRKETAHRFPSFLPDGKRFIFVTLPARAGNCEAFVGSLDGSKPRPLVAAGSAPVFAPPGYLIYGRAQHLVAHGFDSGRLRLVGEPEPIGAAPPPSQYSGASAVSVAHDGTIAYLSALETMARLAWFDRSGREIGTVPITEAEWVFPVLSPDGRRVVVQRNGNPGEADLWLVDLDRNLATRFTFGPGENGNPLWSPDGKQIVFESDRDGPWNLYTKPADGSAPETPLVRSQVLFKHPMSWSPDGRWILYEQLDEKTTFDLWRVPATGGQPEPLIRTSFQERYASVSPDGRWIAYTSDESGRDEIYVQSFPNLGNKHRVSTSGGRVTFWRRDSRELVFFGPDWQTIMVAEVESGAEFRSGTPRSLLRLPPGIFGASPSGDLQRFLAAVPAGADIPPSVTVAMNWASELEHR